MKPTQSTFDRRSLLVGGVTVFGASYLLGARAFADESGTAPQVDVGARKLLLVELNGGNDGLSCVVPYADDVLWRNRERVGLDRAKLRKLDDYRAFHHNLEGLAKIHGEGKLAIVEGTGYPQPNHSHFTSQDIWHTARASGRASGDGWIARLVASLYATDRENPHAVHVGQTLPYALKSSTHPIVCFDSPPAYRWAENSKEISTAGREMQRDAPATPLAQIRSIVASAERSSLEIRRAAATYKPRAEYAPDTFSQDLRTAAALLQSDIGCRVLSVTQQGYDTHEDQPRRHDQLMAELDRGLVSFFNDVRGTSSGDNVVVLVFSEFGRRVADNASMGTDHGTAGPMFLLGTHVRGGLYGAHPALNDLHEGDLKFTTDFRRVYATVLDRWFRVPSEEILGAKYDVLEGALA